MSSVLESDDLLVCVFMYLTLPEKVCVLTAVSRRFYRVLRDRGDAYKHGATACITAPYCMDSTVFLRSPLSQSRTRCLMINVATDCLRLDTTLLRRMTQLESIHIAFCDPTAEDESAFWRRCDVTFDDSLPTTVRHLAVSARHSLHELRLSPLSMATIRELSLLNVNVHGRFFARFHTLEMLRLTLLEPTTVTPRNYSDLTNLLARSADTLTHLYLDTSNQSLRHVLHKLEFSHLREVGLGFNIMTCEQDITVLMFLGAVSRVSVVAPLCWSMCNACVVRTDYCRNDMLRIDGVALNRGCFVFVSTRVLVLCNGEVDSQMLEKVVRQAGDTLKLVVIVSRVAGKIFTANTQPHEVEQLLQLLQDRVVFVDCAPKAKFVWNFYKGSNYNSGSISSSSSSSCATLSTMSRSEFECRYPDLAEFALRDVFLTNSVSFHQHSCTMKTTNRCRISYADSCRVGCES